MLTPGAAVAAALPMHCPRPPHPRMALCSVSKLRKRRATDHSPLSSATRMMNITISLLPALFSSAATTCMV